jgi:hypothetical protein
MRALHRAALVAVLGSVALIPAAAEAAPPKTGPTAAISPAQTRNSRR